MDKKLASKIDKKLKQMGFTLLEARDDLNIYSYNFPSIESKGITNSFRMNVYQIGSFAMGKSIVFENAPILDMSKMEMSLLDYNKFIDKILVDQATGFGDIRYNMMVDVTGHDIISAAHSQPAASIMKKKSSEFEDEIQGILGSVKGAVQHLVESGIKFNPASVFPNTEIKIKFQY